MGVGQVYYTRARENIFPGKSLKRASAASYLSRRASLGGVFFLPLLLLSLLATRSVISERALGFWFFLLLLFFGPLSVQLFHTRDFNYGLSKAAPVLAGYPQFTDIPWYQFCNSSKALLPVKANPLRREKEGFRTVSLKRAFIHSSTHAYLDL